LDSSAVSELGACWDVFASLADCVVDAPLKMETLFSAGCRSFVGTSGGAQGSPPS